MEEYIVRTKEDFYNLANIDTKDKYFKQVANIDFKDEEFKPINFYGYYNGNGYKILGLKQCLFASIGKDAIVENIVIENTTMITPKCIYVCENDHTFTGFGIIAIVNLGLILSCKVKKLEINGFICEYGSNSIGGIVSTNCGNIINCDVELKVINISEEKVGGIAGINVSQIHDAMPIIAYCKVTFEYFPNMESKRCSCFIGSIVGHNLNGYIINCDVRSEIIIPKGIESWSDLTLIGGVVGSNSGSHCTIINCDIQCKIEVSVYSAIGGVTGFNNGDVFNCKIKGEIVHTNEEKKSYIGAIMGHDRPHIKNCIILLDKLESKNKDREPHLLWHAYYTSEYAKNNYVIDKLYKKYAKIPTNVEYWFYVEECKKDIFRVRIFIFILKSLISLLSYIFKMILHYIGILDIISVKLSDLTENFYYKRLRWDFKNDWYWDKKINEPKVKSYLDGITSDDVEDIYKRIVQKFARYVIKRSDDYKITAKKDGIHIVYYD